MTHPQPKNTTATGPAGARIGLTDPAPDGSGSDADAASSGDTPWTASGALGRRAGVGGRRTVVCGGVRGVFTCTHSGGWVLANSEELRVLEGLGGNSDGVSRLRGMEAALAAKAAGSGDLVRLGRCLLSVASAKRVCYAKVPDDLVAAVTVVCGWWEHPAAQQWLYWVLPLRLGGNLSGAWEVGPGLVSWLARREGRSPVWWPELEDGWLDELGDAFWERVRGHPEAGVRAAAEACDPATPARRLKDLAGDHGLDVDDIVASHPSTPGRVLLRLARGYSVWPQWRAAQNVTAPARVLARLAAGRERSLPDTPTGRRGRRRGVRLRDRHGETPPARLPWWLRAWSAARRTGRFRDWSAERLVWWVREAARERVRVRSRRHSSPMSRWLAAQNPSSPPRALRRLARSEDVATRSWAACHPSTPRRALARLVRDDSRLVRRSVCWNPSAPGWALSALASDRHREVRAAAAACARLDAGCLERLAADRTHLVRAAVAASPATPHHLLHSLAEDPHWRVRQSVACRERAGSYLMGALFEDLDAGVRSAVAVNDSAPAEAVARLCDDADEHVAHLAAQHPLAPRQALSRRARSDSGYERWVAAGHPACPPDHLGRLAADPEDWVREETASNPSAPLGALAGLARDGHRRVRAAVAANPSAPDWLVGRLAHDDCVAVFKTAERTLQHRRTAGADSAAAGAAARAG